MLNLNELLETGLSAEIKKTVDIDDAAGHSSPYLGQYLSTSACAALAVQAAMKATENLLPEGYLSVGWRIEIEHDAPAMMGTTVTVRGPPGRSRTSGLRYTTSDAPGAVVRQLTMGVEGNRPGLEDRAVKNGQCSQRSGRSC